MSFVRAKDEMIVYNNPYVDRFVVVKLHDKTITGFDILRYVPSIEHFGSTDNFRICLGAVDILIILILLFVLFICYMDHSC